MIQETRFELYEQMSYVTIRAVDIGGRFTQATNVDKYCLCTTYPHWLDQNENSVCAIWSRGALGGV